MIQITLDDYVNGYSVRAYDAKSNKYLINEICETRDEAVNIIIESFKKLHPIKLEVVS